jgi:NAD(P)-dependent dehydrogenase (short-subunit alcohol dehydrogenase family)
VVGAVEDPSVPPLAVAAAAEMGDLWGLVNNAGISPAYAPTAETSDDDWQQILAVNLRASAAFARAALPAMVAAGKMDLVAETSLKPWDWSALVPVIEAAGGRVVNWRGEAPDGSGQILAVGDERLIEQALVTLKRAAA